MRFFLLPLAIALTLFGSKDLLGQQSAISGGMDSSAQVEEKPFLAASAPSSSEKSEETSNQMVLDVVRRMPQKGGYSVKRIALENLIGSVGIKASASSPVLELTPEKAKPSFCSGATYLVFVGVIQDLLAKKKLQLSSNDLKSLLIKGQSDGEGVWGRWNANGPGTARLFYELGLGRNFQSLTLAKPGDFLKLFWNDQIGAKEYGHSVIFLGTRATPEGGMIQIWSSNLDVGYSEKEVPLGKVKRMLFSRLLNPSAIQSVSQLPRRDDYLASLLTNSSTEEQMSVMVGIEQGVGKDGASRAKPIQETPIPATKSKKVAQKNSLNAASISGSVSPVTPRSPDPATNQ